MEYESYPAIFKSADKASNDTQKYYLNCIRAYNITLVIGVGLGVYGIKSNPSAIIAAILFFIGIFITILLHTRGYENVWYKCRAVAESIKTSTWRFMMRANPYEVVETNHQVSRDFLTLIQNVLKEHKGLSEHLTTEYGTSEQITPQMNDIRSLDLTKRKDYYKINRIDEQRSWYAKKAFENKKNSNKWFGILIFLHAIAIIFVLCRIAYPNWPYWPTEIFIVAGSGVLTWIQVKRFRELSAAYGLTAHEISALRGELDFIQSEADFSQFVQNSENAFSREHTQWIARKDA
jgi:hypothetical protein